MSEVTFNIADYRPLWRGPSLKARPGLVLFSSNSKPREYDPERLDTNPAVVDIRAVREAHWACPRRGKILRFGNPSLRVYTMPAHASEMHKEDDPGPLVA